MFLTGPIPLARFEVMEAPIAEVEKQFRTMIDRAEKGETVTILRYGRPVARLVPPASGGKRWRVNPPDDPARYAGIDLNEPVLGEV